MGNYKHSGERMPVASASGVITGGNLVYQEGFVGVVEAGVASGQPAQVATSGVWYVAVPEGTVKGDRLYADLTAESTNLATTRHPVANSVFIGVAEAAVNAAGRANVRLSPDLARGSGTGVRVEMVAFYESAGAGTYTGSVTVPGGSLITNIRVWNEALWAASTSATMKVGDAADDDGWYVGINLKATDLLVGEEINFDNTGAKEGAYLNLTTGARTKAYGSSDRVISGIITTVGATGATGGTRMVVEYITPQALTSAVKAS
jgi:hypothetical protein